MRTFFLTIFFTIPVLFVNAQEEFSLKKATDFALENNREIQNTKLDLLIAEKKVWETTAQGLPQVSGEVNFQNFINIPTTVVPANMFNPMAPEGEMMGLQFGTEYNVTASLQVSQLVFSGNYLVGLQASRTYTLLSENLIEKKELEIKEGVRSAYYTALLLKENKSVLDSMSIKVEEIYNQTKILVDEKVLERTNLSQLELSKINIQNAINSLDYQIETAHKLLKFTIGLDIEKQIVLTDEFDVFLNEAKGEVSASIQIAETPDYKLLMTQMALSELSLKNTKANYLPTLAAFFNYQEVAQRNEVNFFDSQEEWYPTTLWGLKLSVPIFSSGMRNSQVSQAKIEVEKMENNLAQLDQGLKLQYSRAISDFNIANDNYTSKLKAVEVADEVLKSTEIKYKESVVSAIELTQAQNQYLQAKTDLVRAGFDLINAKLAIDKLLNKL